MRLPRTSIGCDHRADVLGDARALVVDCLPVDRPGQHAAEREGAADEDHRGGDEEDTRRSVQRARNSVAKDTRCDPFALLSAGAPPS